MGCGGGLGTVLGGAAGFLVGGPMGAAVGAGLGGSVGGGIDASSAAKDAAAAQSAASQAGISETRRQYDAMAELMSPYVTAGTGALTAQQELLGLSGTEAQQQAIAGIEQPPLFTSMVQQGEEAMLQGASATGGLRGGNIQGALAQYRPQILSQLIESQYGKLGGLSQMGQSAAAGTGAAGISTGSNIANLLAQQGAAQAGGALGQAQASQGMLSNLMSMGGLAIGASKAGLF